MLICKNYKIIVALILWKYVVNWYHEYIPHPCKNYTEANISQHYYWPNLRENIRTHINVCKSCREKKKQNLKYFKLSNKEAEAVPWDRLLVYIISPYKIIIEVHEDPLILIP